MELPQVPEEYSFLSESAEGFDEPVYLRTVSDVKSDLISEGKDFLEINLPEMAVRLYKENKTIKEARILAVGDAQNWGGSAVGLYSIISGAKLSFSIVSKVYMPYAIHYYGKYYIHGEPYYPSGEKLISSTSGGCIRLQNKDAKDIYELSEVNMPVLVVDKESSYYQYINKELSDFPEISAESHLVADLDSGFVFSKESSEEKKPIASLSQLMAALVIAENIDLRKSILVESEMLRPYGSTQGLDPGKTFRIVELFYPLLIESSDDAAEVLSRFLGRDKTVEKMNEKAKAILMADTEFVDPLGSGLGNVSTGQDLFQMARYLLNNRSPILKISKGEEVGSFGGVGFDIENLWNKNIFTDDPSFVGGKTAYLSQSGHNAVFIFKFSSENEESRNIAIILLGSKEVKEDTRKIYKWVMDNYFTGPSTEE